MDDAQCLSPFLPGTPLHSLSAPLHLPLQAHPWPRCQTKGAIAGPHESTCPRPATPSSLKCAHLVSRTLLGLFLTGTAATSHSPVLPLISCSTLTLGFSFSPACPPPHNPPPRCGCTHMVSIPLESRLLHPPGNLKLPTSPKSRPHLASLLPVKPSASH